MKHLTLSILFLVCFISTAFSQSSNAIYLKDGSRIIGYVQEMEPDGNVRIRTTDGTIQSFPTKEIKNIIWTYKEKEKGPGPIYRYGDTFRWKYNDMELTESNYDRYFDYDLYHTYIGGRNQLNLGGAGLVIGIGCTLLSALHYDSNASKQSNIFYAYAYGADILIGLGCIFTGIGKGRLNWVEKKFNEGQAQDNTSHSSRIINSMKLNPSVMLTAKDDLALGATLVLTLGL